jgi:ketosteroid isomerase-like protein
MPDAHDPLAAEDRFFTSLLDADREALDGVLADDFMLIDVMTGSEIPRAVLLDLVGSRQLVFESVERDTPLVRRYPGTAVVTGRTRMSGRYGDAEWAAVSRYTHVYVEQGGRWRLVAAQGTPIAPEPASS